MKKLILTSIFIFLSISVLFSQDDIKIDVRGSVKVPYTDKPIIDNNFQFAIVSDRTGGHRKGVFKKALYNVNQMQPEFVLSVGDLIEGFTEDKNVIESEWKAFDAMVSAVDARFFYVPGNHDFTNQTMADVWRNRLGPDYYSFRYKNTLFLCLNSEDGVVNAGSAGLGDEQFEYFEKVLEENKDVKWTFVLMHQPLWIQDKTGKWSNMMDLLAKRKHTVLAGHYHRYTHYERNNNDYIVLGPTGGVSKLKGKGFGQKDHITWVTVSDDKNPVITHLMLDGIEGKEFVTEKSAGILNKAMSDPAIYFDPTTILNDEGVSEISLKINNTQPVNMNISMKARAHQTVLIKTLDIDVVVPPKSSKTILIPIEKTQKEVLNTPIIYDAICSFDNKDASHQKWEQKIKFLPIQKHSLHKAKEKIKLDGDLKEWDKLSYTIKDCDNTTFDVRYTKDNIYIAMDIKKAGTKYAILKFDPRSKEKSALNPGNFDEAKRGEYLYLPLKLGEENGKLSNKDLHLKMLKKNRLLRNKDIDLDGYYKKTKNGYSVEYKIPIVLLEAIQGDHWETFRLNVGLMDATWKTKSWQPEWDELIPGTGIFFKE